MSENNKYPEQAVRVSRDDQPKMNIHSTVGADSRGPESKHEHVLYANNRILGVIENLESLLNRIAPVPTQGAVAVDPLHIEMSLSEFLNTEASRMDDRINRCNQLIENLHQELFTC